MEKVLKIIYRSGTEITVRYDDDEDKDGDVLKQIDDIIDQCFKSGTGLAGKVKTKRFLIRADQVDYAGFLES